MIEFLFLLVEILAIVYLIHNIVGVSVKVDVYLIMLLAIGLGITIAIINDLIWDKGLYSVWTSWTIRGCRIEEKNGGCNMYLWCGIVSGYSFADSFVLANGVALLFGAL